MKRYHITVGAKTTADGTVITGSPHWTIDGQPIAREGEGVGGWAAAGFLTAPAVTGLCVGLGVPTGGTSLLVCSVLAVGATSLAGGSIGAVGGEAIGEKIYEAME